MAIRRPKQRSTEVNAGGEGYRGRNRSDLYKNVRKGRLKVPPVINGGRTGYGARVGIAWKDISPFVDSLHQSHSVVADVLCVPKNIFKLENLTELLSYHAWETKLSFSEKEFLHQFLPEGMDADQVVKSLLTGENLHFGNSFTKWSASLFSGNLHSDSILRNNQHLKASKKDYFSSLSKYHNGMMDYLLEWKDFWESCENSEILQSMWSKGMRHPGYVTSEKVMSVRRTSKKGKENKIQVNGGNGDKYNSFLKINRRRHQLVKNAKHSVDHIKSKSLSSNLGDMKGCSVQISKSHKEEERKIITEHWSKLACKDIPNTYNHLNKQKMSREHWRGILEQELAGKQKMIVDKKGQQDDCSVPYSECDNLETPSVSDHFGNGDSHASMECQISEQIDGGESQHQSEVNLQVAGNDSSIPHSKCDDFEKSPDSSHLDLTPMVLEGGHQEVLNPQLEQFPAPQLDGHAKYSKYAAGIRTHPFTDGYSLQNILPLNNVQDVRYFLPNQEIVIPQPMQFHGNIEQTMNAVEPKDNIPSAKNNWMGIGFEDTFCDPQSYLNTSVGGISLGQPQGIKEHTRNMKGLISDVVNDEPANLPSSTYIMNNLPSFFNQIPNQGGSFIPTPVSGRQSLYHNPHQQLNNLRMPVSSCVLSSNGLQHQPDQFPIDFQGHKEELHDLRINRETLSNKNLANKGFAYTMDSYLDQDLLPLPFSADVSRSQQQGFNNVWSGVHPSFLASQPRRNNNNSLFSSLPQSRQFPSIHLYNDQQQLMPQGSYVDVDGTLPGSDGTYGLYSNQPIIFGNHGTSSNPSIAFNNIKLPDMPWTNMGYQDLSMQNSSTGKPFMQETWNNQ